MKKFTLYQTEANEMNEYELSIVIHIILLVVLSIGMIFKTIPQKKPSVVPVTLIAQIEKPKAGAVAPIKKDLGSKKAQGTTNKVSKPKPNAPAKKAEVKSSAKPIKKAVIKPTNQPTKAKDNSTKPTVKTKPAEQKVTKSVATTPTLPVVAVQHAQTNLPSVVTTAIANEAHSKPSHNAPLFKEVSDLDTEMGNPSPLMDNLSGPTMTSDESMVMPDSLMDDSMMFASPEDFAVPSTGTDNGSDGKGLVNVGEIEAYGGNNANFVAPSIISKVQPDYPDWARKQGVHGTAVYRVLIQNSGTVGDVITMSSTIDPKLAIDGAQALRRWVFTPVLDNGVPKETWVKISVAYELN